MGVLVLIPSGALHPGALHLAMRKGIAFLQFEQKAPSPATSGLLPRLLGRGPLQELRCCAPLCNAQETDLLCRNAMVDTCF